MMKQALILLALLGMALCYRPVPTSEELDAHWLAFKSKFSKRYTQEEEHSRRLIWEYNIHKILHHNLDADLGLHSHRLGLNAYADWSQAEVHKYLNGFRGVNRTRGGTQFLGPQHVRVPDTVDWRDKGYVTPVKNQEQCGSCWAFSTTGSLEGQHFKKTGKLVSLSEQNLVDCSGDYGNMGCEGGLMDSAFKYIKANGGIDTEKSYPYTAEDGSCHYNKANVGATVTGYTDIPSGDEDALKTAVATVGPISVAIDASSFSFQLYSGGIYDEESCSSTALDHGVLAVGYGTEDGQDYWLVKNSWGESWGLSGYIKMSRNKNNQCGIATQASYPLV